MYTFTVLHPPSHCAQVWAFGCLLYEVFADGLLPYQGMTNDRVIDFVDSGKRLSAPLGCPAEVRVCKGTFGFHNTFLC